MSKNKMTTVASRRALLGAGVALLAAGLGGTGAAHAQEQAAQRVAIVSALGDAITVVQSEPTTGSHLRNRRIEDRFPVPAGIFDVPALGQLQKALASVAPKALGIPLKLQSASVLGDAEKLIDEDRWVGSPMLNQALQELKATHLLLLRPARGPARVQMAFETMGQGQLAGPGFYLDRHTMVRVTGEGVAARRGYLAPYVYAELCVIDVAKGKVVGRAPIRSANSMTTNSEDGAGDSWDLLTTAQKIETLQDVVKDEVRTQMPALAKAFEPPAP